MAVFPPVSTGLGAQGARTERFPLLEGGFPTVLVCGVDLGPPQVPHYEEDYYVIGRDKRLLARRYTSNVEER